MTATEFGKKAIQGGWNSEMEVLTINDDWIRFKLQNSGILQIFIEQIFLDPKAWQAVGKVEGWKENITLVEGVDYAVSNPSKSKIFCTPKGPEWKWNMHRMIEALCEGKSIEEFLETL